MAFPFAASPFQLDRACQALLAVIGALSLMLLTGYAGQVSLGHAGLLAAGAFTKGILFREANAPFWVTLPAAAVVGALLDVVFGLPSLRLRGLYLAVGTLALHSLSSSSAANTRRDLIEAALFALPGAQRHAGDAAVALDVADHGYVMENGRVVLDGDAARLRAHADIQEFYLGRSGGEHRSYREVKPYRRRRRWYG
jgi:hypothetical protein